MGIFSRLAQKKVKRTGFIRAAEAIGRPFEKALSAGAETFVSPLAREAIRPGVTIASGITGKPRPLQTPFGEVKPLGGIIEKPTEQELKPGEAALGAAEVLTAGPAGTLGRFAKPLTRPLGALAKTGAPALKARAAKTFAEGLRPTTQRAKAFIAKRAPELVEKGFTGTKKQLGRQIGIGLKDARNKFNELGKLKGNVSVDPVFEALSKFQDSFVVQGARGPVISDDASFKAVGLMKDKIIELGDEAGKVPAESLRAFKRQLDTAISRSPKGGFGLTGTENAKLSIQKTTANTIREELAKEFPDVAKLNADFSLLRGFEDVLEATKLRQTGQSGLIRKGAGALIGGTLGSSLGPVGTATTALAGEKVATLFGSTVYKTASAQVKNRLADVLLSGTHNIDKVVDFLQKPGLGALKISDFDKFLQEEARLGEEEIKVKEDARLGEIDAITQALFEEAGIEVPPEEGEAPALSPDEIIQGRPAEQQEELSNILRELQESAGAQ